MYDGKVDGQFSSSTRKALESYQKANGLATTGLPDQLTLYKIYRGIAQE